jgi:hypothetical protein
MERHLVADLSGHGYGHAGMTVPILNALRRLRSNLKLTIRSTVPRAWLAERLADPFDYLSQADFGMVMTDALHVVPNESAFAYWCQHNNWEERVADAAAKLASLKPSLLLSNISYLSLAAARKAHIPSVALSSLNWADVFNHYCGHLSEAKDIRSQMIDAYSAAEVFLQVTPSMPMPSIHNGRKIGPVALVGQDRRVGLRHRMGLDAEGVIALLALGGTPTELPVLHWPRLGKLRLILGSSFEISHPDVAMAASLDFPFLDLVRSSDVLISKPGYGLCMEAACGGIPMLLVSRKGWPGENELRQWLAMHGRFMMLSEEKMRSGDFLAEVEAVRAMPAPPLPDPSGIAEATAILSDLLS